MATTQEALESWRDLIGDFSERWAELLREKELWKDLPPDVAKKILKASRMFAETGETLKAAYEGSLVKDPEIDYDISNLDFDFDIEE